MTPQEYQKEMRRVWEQGRNYLLQMLQPGNPNAPSFGIDKSKLMHRSPYANPNQGQTFQNGRMPNDAEITQFVQSQPAFQQLQNRYEKSQAKANRPAASSSGAETANLRSGSAQPASMALFQQLFGANQAALDRANAMNEARYAEGKGELSTLRGRNQDRVGNWGVAAQADIDERLKENLGNSQANLAARGMSNSTIQDAFAARAARDTAREQQRVSEMRDSRLAEYDTNDTNNLVGFIERRNDVGPDYSGLMAQSLQYAQAEAARASQERQNAALLNANRGTGGRGRSNVRLPVLPGPQGGVMPMFTNGTPLQMAMSAFSTPVPRWGGVSSNRYPTRRSPEEYNNLRANMAAQQQQAQQDDMNAWYSGRRSMLPNYGLQQRTYA